MAYYYVLRKMNYNLLQEMSCNFVKLNESTEKYTISNSFSFEFFLLIKFKNTYDKRKIILFIQF